MSSGSYVRCEVCGGTGRVTITPERRMRTMDDVRAIPRAQVRSIPTCYRSGRLDLFALAKKRERLEKDIRSAHKRLRTAAAQMVEITQEMARIQQRIDEGEQRSAGVERATKARGAA